MDNVIKFEDYKKKNEGGFAPVKVMMTTDDLEVILAKVQKQKEEIEKQKQRCISNCKTKSRSCTKTKRCNQKCE